MENDHEYLRKNQDAMPLIEPKQMLKAFLFGILFAIAILLLILIS